VPAALAQPALGRCPRQWHRVTVPSAPHSLCSPALPLPSALPGLVPTAPAAAAPCTIPVPEGPRGRARASWPGREGGTRGENTLVGSLRPTLLPAARAGVPAGGMGVLGAQLALSTLPRQSCGGHGGARRALGCCLTPAPRPAGRGSLRRAGNGAVGLQDLLAAGAAVAELLGVAGAAQVPPDPTQVLGDPEASVMLAHDLCAGTG